MMEFRACYPEHIRLIKVQPMQREGFEYMIGNGFENRVLGTLAFSGWLGTTCVAAGGVFPQWGRHGIAWMLASEAIGPELLRLTRFGRALYQASPYDRITCDVLCDFTDGHRWAKLLGFELECERMVKYDPMGRDCALYRWLRKV